MPANRRKFAENIVERHGRDIVYQVTSDRKNEIVDHLVKQGYAVHRESDLEIFMVQRKKFLASDVLVAAYMFFCFIIPGLVYIMWRMSQPAATVTIRLVAPEHSKHLETPKNS